jgi:hypothetical protein
VWLRRSPDGLTWTSVRTLWTSGRAIRSSCANIARTDEHITALTAEIARLRAEAASRLLPGPIRQRLAGRAATLEKIAERHARTRIIPGDDDARR